MAANVPALRPAMTAVNSGPPLGSRSIRVDAIPAARRRSSAYVTSRPSIARAARCGNLSDAARKPEASVVCSYARLRTVACSKATAVCSSSSASGGMSTMNVLMPRSIYRASSPATVE